MMTVMRKVNQRTLFVFLSLVFVLVYIFLGAKRLSPPISLEPEWAVDVISSALKKDNAPGSGAHPPVDTSRVMPYKLGQIMGYFTSGGAVDSLVTFPYRAAISRDHYAFFLSNARDTEFFTSGGKSAGIIKGSGFPYFDEDRIFLFHPGGAAFSFVNPDGLTAWTYEGYAPITAFSSSQSGIAAGYADGVIRVFDFSGEAREIEPGGSGFPVILGMAISPDGSKTASISGISPQRFVLTRTDNGVNKVLHWRYLEKAARSQTLVRFSQTGMAVYYESGGLLCIYTIADNSTVEIPINGELLSIAELQKHGKGLVFALSKSRVPQSSGEGDSVYTVWILENFSDLIGSFSFNARYAFITADESNAVYIGKDTTISKINVVRK
ncbi:MAG: hypothetical protein Pg6C_13460 [Treponemataceae bacterium]|nr:MAG: hypothetical protein Pg6C_13460 [Treponemataceae bacterium]